VNVGVNLDPDFHMLLTAKTCFDSVAEACWCPEPVQDLLAEACLSQ
jgi:hypothetical protein